MARVKTVPVTEAPLRPRTFLHDREFRIRERSARAFLAPQRDRAPKVQHPKPPREHEPPIPAAKAPPGDATSAYRGKDNPRAKRQPLTTRMLSLSEQVRVRGGGKSSRRTARVWSS